MDPLPFEDDGSPSEMWLMDEHFYAQLKQALEDFFPSGWFHATARPAHPAYQYWKLCQRLLAQGGVIHVSQQWADLPLLARMGLDALIFVDVTEGNAPLLQVGALQSLGSPAIIRQIQERITTRQDFEDAMAELYVAAWYKGKIYQERQYQAALQEEHSYPWPDLLVEHEALTRPLFYECKRIHAPSKNSISRSIRDANTQIRSAKERLSTPCYGVAVLDLSPAYVLEVHPGEPWPQPPNEIMFLGIAALHGKNSHIDYLVQVWTVFATWLDAADQLRCGFWRNTNQWRREGVPDWRGRNGHLYAGDTLEVRLSGDLH